MLQQAAHSSALEPGGNYGRINPVDKTLGERGSPKPYNLDPPLNNLCTVMVTVKLYRYIATK